jgi:hypothetical protein
MKKYVRNDVIVMRVGNTLKEFLVSEARKREQSLSGLLRFLVRRYLYDKYKDKYRFEKKTSKGV